MNIPLIIIGGAMIYTNAFFLGKFIGEEKMRKRMTQTDIDKLIYGQEVDVPKLAEEELDQLLRTVGDNEIEK